MRHRIHSLASYRDLILRSFTHVSELQGIMNVFQVHVFLHRLRVKLALMRKFTHRSALDRFVDELRMLADKPAKFCKFGIVHFL
ncbi:MAG: hypothetical protein DMG32_24935 [Acidobacteria bacterium]|nr:MAG: hypothetical protein DMG32_24935 [Acidobacteriota bacterium]